MAIIKTMTQAQTGITYSYHVVQNIIIDKDDNVYAGISSWINKDRHDQEDRAVSRVSERLNVSPQPGMVAQADNLLVTDSTSMFYGGTVDTTAAQTDLEKAKTRKKAEITAARNLEMYANKTTTLGVFGSSESDNNKLSIAIQLAQMAGARGQPAECGYADAAGTWSTYTVAQLEQIALEIAGQVLPLYAKEASLVSQVDAAATEQDLLAINW
jgi:hypothetical protein